MIREILRTTAYAARPLKSVNIQLKPVMLAYKY